MHPLRGEIREITRSERREVSARPAVSPAVRDDEHVEGAALGTAVGITFRATGILRVTVEQAALDHDFRSLRDWAALIVDQIPRRVLLA